MLVATAALVAGCATTPKGQETNNPVQIPPRSFAYQWATDLRGDSPITAVHLSDEFVFAYRQDGTSSVMQRDTGKLLHIDKPREGDQRLHPPVVLKDRIVYPTTSYLEVFDNRGRYIEHATHAFDELDKPFSQTLQFPIQSDAVGVGKLVFLGANFPSSGRAVEIDMTRPYVPEVWTLMEPGSAVSVGPALAKDTVFVASDNGKIAAVSIESREPLWPLDNGIFQLYGGIKANLVDDESGLYVASTDTKLYCLQRNSGKVKWQYFANVPLETTPSVTKTAIYQFVPGTGIVCLDKTVQSTADKPAYNREPLWVVGDATQFLAEDEKLAYLRTADNHILAVDKRSGDRQFQSTRNDLVAFAGNTKDGTIYLATSLGRVIAAKAVLQAGQVGEIVMAPVPVLPLALAR